MTDSPTPRRMQFGLGTMLLGVTFLAPWFLLYTYARQRRPDITNGLFLGVIGFAVYMVVLVIIARFAGPRVKPTLVESRPQRPTDYWALASYMLGLISMQFCLMAYLGSYSAKWIFICGVAAIGTGIVALRRTRAERRNAARYFGWIGVIFGTLFGVLAPLARLWGG